MAHRVAALCLILILSAAAKAEEVSARVDLDVIARMGRPQLVPIRINFADADGSCPEDHGNLQVAGGNITIHSARLLGRYWGRDWGDRLGSIAGLFDDETQRLRIAASDCWYEIGVRLQRRGDGGWVSLSVPRFPSQGAPLEEWLKALDQEMKVAQPDGAAKSEPGAVKDAMQELNAAKGLYPDYYPFSIVLRSENAPDDCVPAFGSYLTDAKGITFTFVTNLDGDLNHFVIERADPDSTTAQLHLVRGDCRLEVSLGKASKYQGAWRPLAVEPVLSVTPSNGDGASEKQQ